jgi:hypothetical protein
VHIAVEAGLDTLLPGDQSFPIANRWREGFGGYCASTPHNATHLGS